MNKLYLITGPAGVGKTTISKLIAEKLPKSALIEGDDIYHLVKGGYVNPWQEGNHLDVFWQNSVLLINNFLDNGYDVVFNYIIRNKKFIELEKLFKDFDTKFVVLTVNENVIMKRDQERPLDCQMGQRAIDLLNKFKNDNYDSKYILDTSNLSIDDTVEIIIREYRFKI